MTSCTIIISHYESFQFLRACVRQIKKYQRPDILQHIIIADQSGSETNDLIHKEYDGDEGISIIKMQPLWSGYGIDYCMRFADIKTNYVCQIHVDAFPIHNNWLYLPIKLIEENDFAFVGQLHFISFGTSYAYPPGSFFSMSPTFNVARTETYREMALEGGFTRFHNRTTEFHNPIPTDMPMTWGDSGWAEWAKESYYARGSDDDATAFWWEDTYRQHDKLGLSITGRIALLGREPDFGRVIEDIVFHFGSCRESHSILSVMGDLYQRCTEKIKYGYDEELVDELLNLVQKVEDEQRVFWDGKTKKHSITSEELNDKIEQLKNS